jgi:WD40 repeat protein
VADRGKLRVFISYSRNDLDFADQLDAALAACGYESVIDRHGISGGEDWKRRLGNLISEADTVVFVLSPTSAISPICAWEVDEAGRLGKRILPVICRPLDGASPPQHLRDLNYIFFYAEPTVPSSGFGSGLASLIAALNTDFDWLRQHTRYLQRALEWDAGDRQANRLLSGTDIVEAKAWAARRPKGAPEPTALQLDFIRASEEEAESRTNAQRKQLAAMAAAQGEREKALHEAEEALKQAADAQRKRARNRNVAFLIVTLSALLAGWLWLRAEGERKEAEIALAGSYFHQAVTRLQGEKPFEALAYAARAVALNPDNDAARALTLDLLLWRPWPRLTVQAKSNESSLALSDDGRLLIVGVGENASIYEVTSGIVRGKPLNHQSPITAVALTRDGKLAATGDAKGEIRLWTLGSEATQDRSWTLAGRIHSLAFSRDGRRLAVAAENGARVWNAMTGAPLGPNLQSGSVTSIEFGSNDTRVVIVERDGRVQMWDYERGAHVGKDIEIGGSFANACLDETGRFVMTGAYGAPSFARVWETETGKAISPQLVHKDVPIRGRFIEDGRKLLTISRDGSARVWDLPDGGNLPVAEFTHEGTLLSAAITNNASWVATRASDGSVHVWDRRTGVRRPLTVPTDGPAITGALSANGKFAVAVTGSKAWIMQPSTEAVQQIQLNATPRDVAISNDGQHLAFTTPSETFLMETFGNHQLLKAESRSTGSLLGDLPAFKLHYGDADGILVHSYGQYADILDARNGHLAGKQIVHDDLIRSVKFSQDGERLATASRDGTVRVWNARTGDQIDAPLSHQEAIVAAAFATNSDRVMSASRNALIWSWDLASQRAPRPIPLDGAGLIGIASFGRNGTRIATTDYKTVRAWDTGTGLPLTPLLHPDSTPQLVSLSQDGTRLLTVSGNVSVWDLPMITKEDAPVLVRWGEAMAGLSVVEPAGPKAVENPQARIKAIQTEANALPEAASIGRMIRWFFADPATRKMSPLSEVPR